MNASNTQQPMNRKMKPVFDALWRQFKVSASDRIDRGADMSFTLEGEASSVRARMTFERGHVMLTIGEQKARFPMNFGAVLLAEIAGGLYTGSSLEGFIESRVRFYRSSGMGGEPFVEVVKPLPEPVAEEPEAPRRMPQKTLRDLHLERNLGHAKRTGKNLKNTIMGAVSEAMDKGAKAKLELVNEVQGVLHVYYPAPEAEETVELLLDIRFLKDTSGKFGPVNEHNNRVLAVTYEGKERFLPIRGLAGTVWEITHGYHKEAENFQTFVNEAVIYYTKDPTKEGWWIPVRENSPWYARAGAETVEETPRRMPGSGS